MRALGPRRQFRSATEPFPAVHVRRALADFFPGLSPPPRADRARRLSFTCAALCTPRSAVTNFIAPGGNICRCSAVLMLSRPGLPTKMA